MSGENIEEIRMCFFLCKYVFFLDVLLYLSVHFFLYVFMNLYVCMMCVFIVFFFFLFFLFIITYIWLMMIKYIVFMFNQIICFVLVSYSYLCLILDCVLYIFTYIFLLCLCLILDCVVVKVLYSSSTRTTLMNYVHKTTKCDICSFN